MLIGRDDELRTLDALVAGARLGRSGVLVLSGDAGIGKSALLGHLVDRAIGFHVLRWRATPDERDLPFAGLARILAPFVAGIDDLPGPQARALGTALALYEQAEPSDGDRAPPRRPDRFAVSAATLTLVTRAAESVPLTIVIDDAHLLDTPSAQALAFVARRILVDSIVMLLAVRPGESTAWADLDTLELQPIAAEAAATLADAVALGPLTVEQRHRISELGAGNPLAIRALAQEPDAFTVHPLGQPIAVPLVVAKAFAHRAANLDAETLGVLRVAAITGGDIPTATNLCAALGLSLDRLELAEQLHIVTLGPYRVEFTHPLVAATVISAIPPGERRQLHSLAAAACPPGEIDRRAWHLSEATVGLDDDVATALDEVGQRAVARGAFAVAASAYERAATLTGAEQSRAERFLAAGEAAWLAGDDTRAATLLSNAEEYALYPNLRARARAMAGQVALRGGSLVRARDLLLESAAEASTDAPAEAMLTYAAAVDSCFYLLDPRSAARAGAELERLIAASDDADRRTEQALPRRLAIAAIAAGAARILNGEAADASLRAAVECLTGAPDSSPAEADWALTGLLYLRESGTARDLLQATIETRRRNSELGDLAHPLFHLARHDATTEHWAEAETLYTEAISLAREFGHLTELGASLAGLAALTARQGRPEECRRYAAEAEAVGAARDLRMATAWATFAIAELDLSFGHVGPAIEGFTAVAELLDRLGVGDPDLSPGPELVEALLRAGLGDRATAVHAAFAERAQRKGLPWSLARAARSAALLADDDQLDAAFAAAIRFHDRGSDTFERARTLLLLGSRLRRARRRTEARIPLRDAESAFARLRAVQWEEVASAELEATGLRSRARRGGPVVELTPRELQICQLLAEGRTTRETAAALFLSPKTVEYHLRHAYTKLDITSRAELSNRLGDFGC